LLKNKKEIKGAQECLEREKEVGISKNNS